jgi:hypothetical protein
MNSKEYYVNQIVNGETIKKTYTLTSKRKKQLRNALHRKLEYLKKLKDANTYNCIKCNLLIDRDMLGARNIFLRNIINL